MEIQTQKIENWLDDEAKKLTTHAEYEELPNLKLVPNVIAEFDIDASKPFNEWKKEETVNGKLQLTHKKIIPVLVNGTRMAWWLNVNNPTYKEIITALNSGQKHFKIMQTGTQKATRYNLVK